MSEYWKDAAALLRKAAATIEARSNLRDREDEADLIDVTAELAQVDPEVVLEVMMGLKSARFGRSGDFDSAVDLLAYQARHLAQGIEQPRTVEVPVYSMGVPFDDEEPPLRAAVGDKL